MLGTVVNVFQTVVVFVFFVNLAPAKPWHEVFQQSDLLEGGAHSYI